MIFKIYQLNQHWSFSTNIARGMLKMHDKCALKLEGWARTERETNACRNARAVREVRVQNVSNHVINMGWRRAQF